VTAVEGSMNDCEWLLVD